MIADLNELLMTTFIGDAIAFEDLVEELNKLTHSTVAGSSEGEPPNDGANAVDAARPVRRATR